MVQFPKTTLNVTMKKPGFVYIMTNKNRTTLYIGVTNDLCRRIYEHKNHLVKGAFTDRYNLEYCVYYEEFPYFELAIQREKELKKWNRQKKEALINKKNPDWKVLVTEQGFIRENTLFSEQVAEFLKELQENAEASPLGGLTKKTKKRGSSFHRERRGLRKSDSFFQSNRGYIKRKRDSSLQSE